MSKRIVLMTTALMLALGVAGAASATTAKKASAVHPRSHASLQCSAEANAKGLHGKARVAFRRDCLRKASAHKAAYHKPATKPVHPASAHKKIDKADKKA